ncbi:MAG: hypothetical protein ABW224_03955 [Kibdelosporangium sp.]
MITRLWRFASVVLVAAGVVVLWADDDIRVPLTNLVPAVVVEGEWSP